MNKAWQITNHEKKATKKKTFSEKTFDWRVLNVDLPIGTFSSSPHCECDLKMRTNPAFIHYCLLPLILSNSFHDIGITGSDISGSHRLSLLFELFPPVRNIRSIFPYLLFMWGAFRYCGHVGLREFQALRLWSFFPISLPTHTSPHPANTVWPIITSRHRIPYLPTTQINLQYQNESSSLLSKLCMEFAEQDKLLPLLSTWE